MALSARSRQKGLGKAMAHLPAGTRPRAYAVGRAHARITSTAIVVGALFVAAFVIALALGYLIFPSIVLVLVMFHEIRPPRAIVVTDQGIAVMARSLWHGGPSKVLALLPLVPLRAANPSGSVTVEFGPERITLSRGEFTAVAAASEGGVPPVPSAPAPMPAPMAPPAPPASPGRRLS